MAQPKVFVSHSHVDDAFAERLVKDLRAAGADAWLDKDDLGAGDFQERIDAALANCEWFVLVLTRDALASSWVQQEVRAANRLKHQGRVSDLIFISAGPVEHRELPPLWGVYNIFDAMVEYTAARDGVLKAVGVLGKGTPVLSSDSRPTELSPDDYKLGRRTSDGGGTRGENVEQPMEITLRETYVGASRVFTIQQPETCTDCNGTGKISSRACVTCGGTGIATRKERVTVNVPAGVDTGAKVRVAGLGGPSPTGGPRGDLYLNVTVLPIPQFERHGDDLIMEAHAPLTTLTLGGELPLRLIDGRSIIMTIPPETQNGQMFRVTGKGMPKPNSEERGDLIVRMHLVLP